MPTPLSRRLLCASLLLTAVTVRAQLASSSPFMPPQSALGPAAPTAASSLEYRGIADFPDGTAFRIVDPVRKTGVWARLNQRDADLGVVVKQNDSAREMITVEQQGRTFTLTLRQSKVASSGAVMPVAQQLMQVPTIAATVQGQPIAAPASPLQQAQIDAVAAAVAQRRAVRDQAAQQVNPGAPVTLPQLQQQPPRGQNGANQNQNARGGRGGLSVPGQRKTQP